MSGMEPSLFIVLPVHNRRELTVAFAHCLKRQTWKKWVLVLVDDGSSDGTSEAIEEILGDRVSIVKGNGALWWAGGVNAGFDRVRNLSAAPSDLLLIINDDVIFAPDFLEHGVSVLNTEEPRILLARSVDDETGDLIDSGSRICWPIFKIFRTHRDADINIAPSRGLLMRWESLEELGPFRADILPHYCSDSEFTYRAWTRGYRFQTAPEFTLRLHSRNTGVERIRVKGTRAYWKTLFSMRSIHNPRILTRFVWAACPPIFVLPAILKIWLSTGFKYLAFLTRHEDVP